MSTFVWVMVFFAEHYGGMQIGALEFESKTKCEKASAAITESANQRLSYTKLQRPWCVKIEK